MANIHRRSRDISKAIAYPKSWQKDGKWNEDRPTKSFPKMPLVIDDKTGKLTPIFTDKEKREPMTFLTAREEAEYMKANPDMAQRIAAARATQIAPADKLAASNDALRKLTETTQQVTAERNLLENTLAETRDELAAARAELAAARARQRAPVDAVADHSADEVDGTDAPAPKKRGRRTNAEIAAARAARGE